MKRASNLYYRIYQYDNLCNAFVKSAKGKHDRDDVIAFRNNFQNNIMKLRNQLIYHDLDIGHYHYFKIFDPKHRSICAASFPERVLHHAVMNVCEPFLDSYAIFDTYACRKGKGNRKAIYRTQYYSRKFRWYLKLDIRKYFDSIDHGIMMKLLARCFKDKDLLSLFQKIIDTYHCVPGKGLAIGNLISQYFANYYLGCFDHWIKEERKIKGYVRYMDDMLFFAASKSTLKDELYYIRQFLNEKLQLTLKENIQLNRCSCGIPFLGFRIFPGIIRLSSASRSRFVKKFRKNERKWNTGVWSMKELVRHMEPLIDFTQAAQAYEFRLNVIQRYGVSP